MKFSNSSRKWWNIFFFTLFYILPVSVFAQDNDMGSDPCKGKICNPLNPSIESIPKLIQIILEGALKIGIPLLALAIIYSGFLFVAARGNSEKLEKAKDSLLYTIIGGAILLGSWAIAQMIESTVLSITS